jgi:predicted DNA-binding transcriptional regulator YafY
MAQKLGISRATLFRDLDLLKSIGAPVRYCRISQIHYYEEDFHMSREEFFEKIL